MVQPERIQPLNTKGLARGAYVLYWMQASQRADFNHALEHAARRANALGQPLLAAFGITDRYPQANERHYAFMLEGLRETQGTLRRRGVQLVVRRGSPDLVTAELAGQASLVVTDRGYTRVQRTWRRHVARSAPCRVVQVETDVVVPVEVASDKDEHAAATLRPKIHRHLERYLAPLKRTRLLRDSLDLRLGGMDLQDVDAVLRTLDLDRGAGRVKALVGGTSHARRRLREFLSNKLDVYATRSNDPSLHVRSDLSAYLHFGQISPVEIARQVRAATTNEASRESYLEQLIVRRELSANFLRYNDRYTSYRCLPSWARAT